MRKLVAEMEVEEMSHRRARKIKRSNRRKKIRKLETLEDLPGRLYVHN